MAWVDNNEYPPLTSDWADVQEKVFTRWLNTHLKRREPPIELKMGSLYRGALCSGIILWELIDQIATDKPTKKVDRRGKMRIHYINNINITIDFLTAGNLPNRKPLKFVNVGAEDILDKKKVVAGFIWTIILRFQVSDCSIDHFIAWLNSIGIMVRNLTTDWQDGSQLAKLVNILRPDYVRVHGDPTDTVEEALRTSEDEFAIPRIIDASDMVDHPEERSNFVYLSYFKQMWDDLNGSSCRLMGEPKRTVRARKPCVIEVKTWDVKDIVNDVEVSFTLHTGEVFPIKVESIDRPDCADGRTGYCTFTLVPPRAGIYTSSVKVGGREMRKGPIIVNATPAPSAKIISIPQGKQGIPSVVSLATQNGLATDDLYVELVDSHGKATRVPAIFSEDGLNPGQFNCLFVPPMSGNMTLRILYKEDDQEVEGSGAAFTVFGKPSIDWDSTDVPDRFLVGVTSSVILHAVGHDADGLDVTMKDSDGNYLEVTLEDRNDGTFVVSFTPESEGMHCFDIKTDLVSVEGLPRNILVEAKPSASFTGPRELVGVAMKPVTFDLATVNLKPSEVKLAISDNKGNPVKLPVDVKDNGNGTFTVSFTPTNVGTLDVNVEVFGSDLGNLSVNVAPPPVIVGGVDEHRKARATKLFQFQLDASNIAAEEIRVDVKNERGEHLPHPSVHEGNPNFTVSFVPPDPGVLKVSVWPCYENALPLTVNVLPIAKFIGETHHVVVATKPFSFKVQGAEGISLEDIAVFVYDNEGKKIAQAKVSDNGDGTYTAGFTPEEPGNLEVRISTCGDFLDTPLSLKVLPSLSLAYGESEVRKAAARRPFSFDIQGQKGLKAKHISLNIGSEKGSQIDPPVVKENPDGSFTITFIPPKPDVLDVDVLAHGTSAFKLAVEVLPTCHLEDGLNHLKGYASKPVEFTLKADAGLKPSDVVIEAKDKDGHAAPFTVTDNGDGTFKAAFTPKHDGDHSVVVSAHGLPIGPPLTAEILPLAQFAESLLSTKHKAIATKPFSFDINAEGIDEKDIHVDIVHESGAHLPPPVLEKKGKGVYKATFIPEQHGELQIGLTTKGVPFDKKLQVEVAPMARFHGDSKRHTTATKLFEFALDAPGLSVEDVKVQVEGKHGGALPHPKITDNGNGTFNVAFTPMACDDLVIDISTKGVKFDTPLEVEVAPIASFLGDTKRIGTATKPFSFNLSAKHGLKPKDVHVDVLDEHGKKIAESAIVDNGNETFTVTFTPMEPGDLKVHVSTKGVLFDTPLEVHVRPTAKFLGGGRRQATATKPFDFSLGADQLKLSDVKVLIKDHNGKQLDPPSITDSGDGTFNVAFTPMEHGLLSVEVLAHGEPIGSPMEVEVAPIARFLGDLERVGHSTKPFHFTLDAPALSPEHISVSITNDKGYPLPPPTIEDNNDGTFDVSFVPMDPCHLLVEVSTKGEKFDTPLRVKVLPTAKWTTPTTLPARATIPVHLKMRAEEGLTTDDVSVDLHYTNGEEVEHTLTDNGDGTFTLSFTPPEEGELNVAVSAHGDPIGEATKVIVAPPPYASLPDGPPLRDATQNKPFSFKLDCVSLFPNEVKVMMGDEEVDVQVKDMRDGTFDVTLVPTKVGDFPIKVSFQGKPAAGKPFSIQVAPQPDVLGFSELKGARVAKPFVIGLKTVNLKPELVEVALHDSEGKQITNFKLSQTGEDAMEISFVPKIPGDHTFNMVVDSHEAEASGLPATFEVAPKPNATLVGDKKRKGVEGKLFEFKMDTINLRPEDIRLEITDDKGEKIWREDALAGAVVPTTSTTSTHASPVGRVTSSRKKPKKGKEEDQSESLSAPKKTPRSGSSPRGASPREDAINTPALKGIKVPGDIVISPPDVSKKGDTFKCTFVPWKPGKFDVRVTFEDVIVDLQVTAEPKPKTKTVEILEQLGLNAGFRNIGDEKELLKRIKEKREELIGGYTRNSGLSDTYKEREKTISLLVRNQTSIVAINRAKKRTQRAGHASTSSTAEAATFHRNRKKMALYGNLFYLLRTEPHYLSRLITLANSKEMNSHIIRTLFSNAYTPIQQTMLLKLIATSLSYHVKTTTSFEDYKKESASVNLFILFIKETKEGREFMKRHFQKPVLGLLEQPLFTTENADLYKTWAETFYNTLISAIDDLPYGIRYVCSIIYHELQARYPEIEQTALLSAVGWVISYRFINLVNIADWGLVEISASDEHQFVSNAASIMKVLNSLFLDLKGLPATNPHCKTFDKWITSELPNVKTFLKEVIDVPSPEEHYKVSNYSYLGEGESIAIPLKEIVLMHNECDKNRDELVNKEDPQKDPLYVLLEELGSVPSDGTSDKTQISLPLTANSKFEIQLSAVERVSNLKLETINELLYLFSEYPNVNGETLLEMFLLVKHQATTAATPKPKDAAKVDVILGNLAELAKEDSNLKKSNGYNDFIDDIRTELLAKEKHMTELRYELRQLSDAISELDEQKRNLSEAIKAYDDYLKSISDELQRNFKTTMKKFTWKQLTDKKCCIIAGTTLTQAQQKGCKFEITHMSAEEFRVKGKVAMFSQEFHIKMSDLLDAKDSGELAYDTGQGVVLDVANTLVFLNAKFFNKKRKYVSAK